MRSILPEQTHHRISAGNTRERNGTKGTNDDQTRRQREADRPCVYNRIRVLRTERGLSQKDLGEILGINHRTVGYLEREQYMPSLSLAWRTAAYFGLPLEAVFSPEPFAPMSAQLYATSNTSNEEGV